MNSCNFTGRLTADLELKTSTNGISVTSFTLAVKRPMVKDTTDFINFAAWRSTAEYLSKYAKKGDLIAVTGVLTSRNYEDKNGNKRTAFEVVCNNAEVIQTKSSNQNDGQPNSTTYVPSAYTQPVMEEITEDEDLPF